MLKLILQNFLNTYVKACTVQSKRSLTLSCVKMTVFSGIKTFQPEFLRRILMDYYGVPYGFQDYFCLFI